MPRYITPSPSTSRSRSCSRSQSSLRRGRSVDTSYRGRRDRSVSTSASPTHDAKEKTIVKSSLAFLGAVGAASLLANKYWPKGVLYGEKEEWAKKCERPLKAAKRMRPDGHETGARRHKIEWEDGMTSEGRRSNIGPRHSISESVGESYHYVVGGSSSGGGSGSGSFGRSRAGGSHRDRRPRVYQDAAVSNRRKSCAVDGGPGDLKYVETQAPGPHSVPRRYIVDDHEAVIPRRSSRRYSVVER